MKVSDAIAEILKLEGAEFLSCYPTTKIIDASAKAGLRPIVCRQERVGMGIADGYSRVTNGKRLGVFAMQYGPGTENAFSGVATAYSDSVPVLILPLFFKLEPLVDPDLRHRLLLLAERSQTKIRNVFQINLSSKTSAGNAMLMGWGNTRRIVLGDTLLQRYNPREIEVIMAHELGHHRHGDQRRGRGRQHLRRRHPRPAGHGYLFDLFAVGPQRQTDRSSDSSRQR